MANNKWVLLPSTLATLQHCTPEGRSELGKEMKGKTCSHLDVIPKKKKKKDDVWRRLVTALRFQEREVLITNPFVIYLLRFLMPST